MRRALLAVTLALAVIAAAGVVYFAACHDAIYSSIMSAVPLGEGLQGDIMRIVHCGDRIFVANGNIYMKTVTCNNGVASSSGQWEKIASPGDRRGNVENYFIPDMVYFLASGHCSSTGTSGETTTVADDGGEDWLYALAYHWAEDEEEGVLTIATATVYAAKLSDITNGSFTSNSWKAVTGPSVTTNGGSSGSDNTPNWSDNSFALTTDTTRTARTMIFDDQWVNYNSTNNTQAALQTAADGATSYTASRTAYIRVRTGDSNGSVYKLNGDQTPSGSVTIDGTNGNNGNNNHFLVADGDGDADNCGNVISACRKKPDASVNSTAQTADDSNGITYFTHYYGLSGNKYGVYWTGSSTMTDNSYETHRVNYSNKLYFKAWVSGSDSNSDNQSIEINRGYALSTAALSDGVLLGTTRGLYAAEIQTSNGESGQPTGNGRGAPGANGSSVISEHVYMVFALDPSKHLPGAGGANTDANVTSTSSGTTATVADNENANVTDLYASSRIYGSISSSSDSWDDAGLYWLARGADHWTRSN